MVSQFCELEIKAVVLHRRSHEPAAILQDGTGLRVVTVPVDLAEAGALISRTEQLENGLPYPLDLIATLFDEHRFSAEGVFLTPGEKGQYGARLNYRSGRRRHQIVVRAGEALLLSVHFDIPVYMHNDDLRRCSSCGLPASLDLFSQDVLLLDSVSPRQL
ncbi:bifunctional nuclease domain-containing protein [Salinispira pacifica]